MGKSNNDYSKIKIGYITGMSNKVNERVIDEQWNDCLRKYAELEPITPIQMLKLFGGSFEKWLKDFPISLIKLSDNLDKLCRIHKINVLYINMPVLFPYLLMARNKMGIDIRFLFIVHSVASEYWMRLLLSVAPWIRQQDLIISNTESSKQALLRLSPCFEDVYTIPLCLDVDSESKNHEELLRRKNKRILSIGRIEDVKNIGFLINWFNELYKKYPSIELVIVGEYTGVSEDQKLQYQQKINSLLEKYNLGSKVIFTGALVGQAKQKAFREAYLLVNFSIDPGETFGFNLLEAKSMGTPVICSRWNGFKELVKDGEDGFLVKCDWVGDIPQIDMEDALKKGSMILENNGLWISMSTTSLKNYDKYKSIHIIPEILSEIIARENMSREGYEIERIAMTPIELLPEFYQVNNLKKIGLNKKTPISILEIENKKTPLSLWLPKVKPIIDHFAEESFYANN
ncbi:glycosyltransferase family 4 protein [Paenibacillus sp. KN14-4R]|uniref:glycosyltransferase family 4 protein n=1 Tax=Paenibacillus sp. KN14-4R TaxID=3445773 RepID=UPI003FA12873